jgi:hypothetical protein
MEESCRHHSAPLGEKTIVYKHVEHWDFRRSESIKKDASPNQDVDRKEKGQFSAK